MPELYPEDQKKVDEFIKSNVNSVERKPFRPMLLLFILVVILAGITLMGFYLSGLHGVI